MFEATRGTRSLYLKRPYDLVAVLGEEGVSSALLLHLAARLALGFVELEAVRLLAKLSGKVADGNAHNSELGLDGVAQLLVFAVPPPLRLVITDIDEVKRMGLQHIKRDADFRHGVLVGGYFDRRFRKPLIG